jgi:predicted nucleotidyltransferase
MAMTRLPPDFKEFLWLLADRQVEYLLVGGYAVAFHGYPRATVDMDVWIRRSPENAEKIVAVLREFGFDVPNLQEGLFLKDDQVVRMGLPPVQLEIFTAIPGVTFERCDQNRIEAELDGVPVRLISLADLRTNKKASGRHKDLSDLDHLPAQETREEPS